MGNKWMGVVQRGLKSWFRQIHGGIANATQQGKVFKVVKE